MYKTMMDLHHYIIPLKKVYSLGTQKMAREMIRIYVDKNNTILGHENVARLLIENKADVNVKSYNKTTPLQWSAKYGNITSLKRKSLIISNLIHAHIHLD